MMRLHNITRRLLATCALAATCAFSSFAGAQSQSPAGPEPADVALAYTKLRAWTNDLALPQPEDAAARVAIRGSEGVCIIVRRSGRMLGWGADTAGDDLMLRRACSQAFGQTLSDHSVSALSQATRDSIGPGLTVELEVAGEFTPLVGSTLGQIAQRLEPGLDGIALRRGQEMFALFPSQMRATNTAGDPASRLLALAVKLGLNAESLSNLARQTDVAVYGFRTAHLIQPEPNRSPIQTFRGDVVVPLSAVDRQSIIALADGLANHLRASLWPQPGASTPATPDASGPPPLLARKPLGLMGNYLPSADVYEPLVAGPMEQALCALALQRYAQCTAIDPADAGKARAASAEILQDLAIVTEGEFDPTADPAASAAIIVAILAQPEAVIDRALTDLLDRAAASAITSFAAGAGFSPRADADGIVRPMSPHSQALIAGAMCKLLLLKDDRPASASNLDAKIVRAALESAWRSVPQHQQVALLPWIGWAEIDYTRATGKALAHEEDLKSLRDALERSRIGENTTAAPDLIGGFNLTAANAQIADLFRADAQSVRPAAWLASLLRDERFTPPGRMESALARHMLTMRFLVQLSTRENPPAVLAAFRNPPRAVGGLRSAPWDWNQPLPAQALALITAAHTLSAMEAPRDAGKPR